MASGAAFQPVSLFASVLQAARSALPRPARGAVSACIATAGPPGTNRCPGYVTAANCSHPCGTSASIQGEQPLDSSKRAAAPAAIRQQAKRRRSAKKRMVYGIVTIGPAGVGKTTMCHALQIHGRLHKRGIYVVNLDPAADTLPYEPDIDVRELIRVEDAMREFGYGPNGGLIYCMEYLAMHLEWLEDKISEFGEDDTLLFDCPGQIELYTHLRAMPQLVRALQESCHVKLCATFLVDAVSIDQPAKFVAAALAGLSAMLQLPVPHVLDHQLERRLLRR